MSQDHDQEQEQGQEHGQHPPSGDPLPLLQLGVSVTLAVLFVVMLVRATVLSRDLQRLDRRLRTVENSQVLERSNALEQQMRSMLERLRSVEGQGARLEALERERERLDAEISRLRSQGRGGKLPSRDSGGQGEGPSPPPLPPPPRFDPSGPPTAPSSPGALRSAPPPPGPTGRGGQRSTPAMEP